MQNLGTILKTLETIEIKNTLSESESVEKEDIELTNLKNKIVKLGLAYEHNISETKNLIIKNNLGFSTIVVFNCIDNFKKFRHLDTVLKFFSSSFRNIIINKIEGDHIICGTSGETSFRFSPVFTLDQQFKYGELIISNNKFKVLFSFKNYEGNFTDFDNYLRKDFDNYSGNDTINKSNINITSAILGINKEMIDNVSFLDNNVVIEFIPIINNYLIIKNITDKSLMTQQIKSIDSCINTVKTINSKIIALQNEIQLFEKNEGALYFDLIQEKKKLEEEEKEKKKLEEVKKKLEEEIKKKLEEEIKKKLVEEEKKKQEQDNKKLVEVEEEEEVEEEMEEEYVEDNERNFEELSKYLSFVRLNLVIFDEKTINAKLQEYKTCPKKLSFLLRMWNLVNNKDYISWVENEFEQVKNFGDSDFANLCHNLFFLTEKDRNDYLLANEIFT